MFIYAAPAIGSFLGSTFTLGYVVTSSGALVAITVTGAQIAAVGVAAAIGLGILFASTERPGNNRKQNKQFLDAARAGGYDIKDPNILDVLQDVHQYIRRNKLNLGFKQLVELIKEFLG